MSTSLPPPSEKPDLSEKDIDTLPLSPTSSASSGQNIEEICAAPITPTRSRTRNAISNVLAKTHSTIDIGPPPDGGRLAWLQVLCAHLVLFNCWGWIQSFGVFQAYFTSAFDVPPSNASWIGSLQIFLLFSVGMFSGRALDAGFFRPVFFTGVVLQVLGVMTLSAGKEYWQLLLSGGLVQGIGAGMTFCPTIALVSTYFNKRRSLAIGLTASGSAIGGIVYPAVVRGLLPKIGYGWSVRVCGFIMGTLGIIAGLGLRTRVPPRKSGPLIDPGAFKEGPYMSFCVGSFLFFFGIFFPFYYSSSFVRDIVGMSYEESATVLIMMNAVGFLSRIVPNYIADRYTGPMKMLLPCLIVTSTVTYLWSLVSSRAGAWGWCFAYGLVASAVQGLFPAVLSTMTVDLRKQGTRMGMGFTIAGLGGAVGSPIGGALIQAHGGGYLYAQMYAGSIILAGAVLVAASAFLSRRAKQRALNSA